MADIKFSDISPAGSAPASTDQVVGVSSGPIDNLYSLSQIFTSMGSQGTALTKTNDTNVTLTLGGTPATALLKSTSITVGWTGLLDMARGGTGLDMSATGGAKQYLKQATLGGAVTVGTIPTSDLSGTVSYAQFTNGAGLSFVGRSASSSGVQADITGTANQIPIVDSGGATLAFTTVSGDLTNATGVFTIGSAKVTYAKFVNGGGLSFVGRSASSAGVQADITGTANQIPIVNNAGTSLAFVTVSGDLTNVTGAFTIAAAAVSYAKIANGTGLSLIGRSASSAGVNADLVGTANQIPIVNNAGTSLAFVTVSGDLTNVTGAFTIAAAAVTYAKMQNISAASLLLGRGSAAGAGVPQEITLGTNLSMSGTTLNASGSGGIAFPQSVTSGVSGGVPYFSSTTVMSAGALLAASAVVLGGGAGNPPATTTTGTGVVTAIGNAVNTAGGLATSAVTSLSSLVTVGTLTGGATGAGFTVALGTSTITGILGSANGGTANGFTKFSGPASSEKTFTLPNSSQTVAMLDLAGQVVSGGATCTAFDNGSSSFTVDFGKGPIQKCTITGSFVITAPAADGSCIIEGTNSSATTLTFTSFTSTGTANRGDTYNATGTNKFSLFIWRANGISDYFIKASQP